MTRSTLPLSDIHRVLLVRLRSIGDTVLMTPCISALKEWQPQLEIDVLVEALSAPVLSAHPDIAHLWVIPKLPSQWDKLKSRMQILAQLRQRHYDLVVNLHGGTTATFISYLAGAKATVGYQASQYSWLMSQVAPPPQTIWQKSSIHCVEQQLGLLKWLGIPVSATTQLKLAVDIPSATKVQARLQAAGLTNFVAIHPSAAFPSKQWEAARFARIIEYLNQHHKLPTVLVVAPTEAAVAAQVVAECRTPVTVFADLNLAELKALIGQAKLFIGNDSGPAHIAAALGRPLIVIFGSSNVQVWHPWTITPYRVLNIEMACAPCPGYVCSEFAEPECIKRITVDQTIAALNGLLVGLEENPPQIV